MPLTLFVLYLFVVWEGSTGALCGFGVASLVPPSLRVALTWRAPPHWLTDLTTLCGPHRGAPGRRRREPLGHARGLRLWLRLRVGCTGIQHLGA